MQDLHILPRPLDMIVVPQAKRPPFVNEVTRAPARVSAAAPAAKERPRILARRAARWARRDAR